MFKYQLMNGQEKKNIQEIFESEIISLIGGLIAGALLVFIKHKIELVPGILIFLPGYLDMKGSIYGSLSARLGSALHRGVFKHSMNKRVYQNVIASIILSVFFGLLLGIFAMTTTFLLTGK